jgi:hypothetical protein
VDLFHLQQHSAATELYNGTSWVSAPPITTARRGLPGAGTQTAGLGFGGRNSTTILSSTEEWTLGSQTTATASTLTTS